MNRILYALFAFGLSSTAYSQCVLPQVAVTLEVVADQYGYEGYWEITPGIGTCGTGTIAWGGNTAVGCVSGGQLQDPGGYASNAIFIEGPWCFALGDMYTLHYRDDWGDGGFIFRIKVNGFTIREIAGTGEGDDYTFTIEEAPQHDVSLAGMVNSTRVMGYYQLAGDVILKAQLENLGAQAINSLEVNYQVDGGAIQTESINNLNIGNYESYKIEFPSPWNITTAGTYSVQMWVSLINGMPDEQPGNEVFMQEFEIGPGIPNIISDYSIADPTFEVIAGTAQEIDHPTDLDFHSTLSLQQLWVVNKETANSGGTTIVIDKAGDALQSSEFFQDGNAWHFMSLPTGIAFGDNGNFATSPGVFDANHQGTASAFTGPTLWSGDLDIFAQPSGGNGSHLDMLHESPYSQGIAWERDNAYWVFDGYSNDIVRYDFVDDHNPGNSDHSDALVRRYSDVEVLRDPQGIVPSHLVLDDAKEWLYVVDHGNQRVIRVLITSGTVSPIPPAYGPHEDMVEYITMTGYTWETVVNTGLVKPTGIAIMENYLLVSDYQTAQIRVYDVSTMPASLEFTIQTPAEGIMGIVIGPDGSIFYADHNRSEIVKITPNVLSSKEILNPIGIYPNPSQGSFSLRYAEAGHAYRLRFSDLSGRQALVLNQVQAGTAISPSLDSGLWIITVEDESGQIIGRTPWVLNR